MVRNGWHSLNRIGELNAREIPGVHFDEDVLTKRARIPFEKLTPPDALKKVKEAMALVIEQVNVECAKSDS